MTFQAALTAFVELALMLAVVAAYVVMARRFRLLWHPLSIVAAVGIVSVVVSVLGELLFNSGRAGVPAMLRKRPHAQLQAANPENSTFQPSANPRTGVFADISPVFASAA